MGLDDKRIIFVCPCLNEEGRVGKVIGSVRKAFSSSEVVVVDDCSSDGSGTEARDAGATVLTHFCNLGYGAALQTGYMYALQNDHDILVQLDADGQHSPDAISALIAPIVENTADLCIGSRHLSQASSDTPFIRRCGQNLFASIIRLFGGPTLSDPTSGFQAMNRKAVSLFAQDIFPCDYPDSDVILLSHYVGLRIMEVPTRMEARSGGDSLHSGLKPIYYSIKMIFSMLIVLLNRSQWKRLGKALSVKKEPQDAS